MPLDVIVLAAGLGKRMRSALPKVLHPLGGRPLLACVLDTASELGARKTIVVQGHGAEAVRSAFANTDVHWAVQAEQLGTGHAVQQALPHVGNVRIEFFKGLLVEFAREHGAEAIVKGLRAVSDFDYELQMAQMNQQLSGIDTFFISTSPQYSFLSSSLVREVARFGGDVSGMVPPAVALRLKERFAEEVASRDTRAAYERPAGLRPRDLAARAARDHRHRAHDAHVGVGARQPGGDPRADR